MADRRSKTVNMSTKTTENPPNSQVLGVCQLLPITIACFCTICVTLVWWLEYGREEEDKSWSTWVTKSAQGFLGRREDDPTLGSRLFSFYYSLLDKYTDMSCYLRTAYDVEFAMTWEFVQKHYVLATVLVLVPMVTVIMLYCICCGRNKLDVLTYNEPDNSFHTVVGHHYHTWCSRFIALFFTLLLVTLLISIPWEFIRLYQVAVSKKAAVTIAGMPAECRPDHMSVWQTVKSWLRYHFSWSADPCEEYHKAVLIDPLWEVTPMMVLSSAIMRCITHPFTTMSSNLGDSLRTFLSSVPSPWQPVVLVILIISLFMLAIMSCGYRISLPMFIHIEPTDRGPIFNGPRIFNTGPATIAARRVKRANRALENFSSQSS